LKRLHAQEPTNISQDSVAKYFGHKPRVIPEKSADYTKTVNGGIPCCGECLKCNRDYSVENDKSLHGHCTNERRVRKQNKKMRIDVI